jgi:hypothetical protein
MRGLRSFHGKARSLGDVIARGWLDATTTDCQARRATRVTATRLRGVKRAAVQEVTSVLRVCKNGFAASAIIAALHSTLPKLSAHGNRALAPTTLGPRESSIHTHFAPFSHNPDTQQVREALPICACEALCGTEGQPFTTASPTSPPVLNVDPPLANVWGAEIFSSGQCIMGQHSKRVDVLGGTVYQWVANPAVACAPCICPEGPLPTSRDAGSCF